MNATQLKAFRKRHGLRQPAMARKLGIADRTYWGYENGSPIPFPVQLACAAIELGIDNYQGQPLACVGVDWATSESRSIYFPQKA